MRWRWFLPGYLWALPLTLIGFVLAIVYRAHSFRWHEGVLVAIGGTHPDGSTRIWGGPGAQTHGWLVFAASEKQWARKDLRVHEFTHVKQAFVGGLLYGIAYVSLYFVIWASKGFGPWHDAYRANPFEDQTYHAGTVGWGDSEPNRSDTAP